MCREANERVVVSGRLEEELRRDREQREAEREEREAERLRRAERDYQRAIAAGGDTATAARWERLSDETGSRYGLCQWALDNGEYGACFRRTASVYCWRHNRQLDRESQRRRREKERASTSSPHSYDSKEE